MGTIIDLMIEHENPSPIMDEVIDRLKLYEKRFSANDPTSELMEVNKQAGLQAVSVHPELYELIKIGKTHSCAAGSHLNIAIGPLVQSWRIGFDDAKVPTSEEIAHLLNITDPQQIQLDDATQSVFLKQAGMFIDLGALAKGYIADLLIDYLKSEDVSTALINLGGNIVALGPGPTHQKPFWRIGIQQPKADRNEHVMILKIKDKSIVTSGIYERKHEKEGKTYHHILDPKTGYPMETDIASLTIVSDLSVDGEIWTTRLFGKPADEIIQELNRLDKIEGVVITKDEQVLYSEGIKEIIL